MCPGGRWVNSGSFSAPWESSGSFRVVGYIPTPCGLSGAFWYPACRRVQSGSLGSLGCAMSVIEFILGHPGACWWSSGSFAVVGFIRVRPGSRLLQSGSMDSFKCVLAVFGFNQGRCKFFFGRSFEHQARRMRSRG